MVKLSTASMTKPPPATAFEDMKHHIAACQFTTEEGMEHLCFISSRSHGNSGLEDVHQLWITTAKTGAAK
jgi:hypothetical protein